MNELIFFGYLALIVVMLLIACRLGYGALCAMISLYWVLANLFVTKTITLFGFHATSSDALAVGAVLGLNLVQERYGRAAARTTILTSTLSVICYTLAGLMHTAYIPSATDSTHLHFLALLTPMPRILIASLATSLIVQWVDYALYGFLLTKLPARFFIARNYISLAFTQALDTLLFSFLGLYGIVDHLWDIIAISYGIKLLTLLCITPFLTLSRTIKKPIVDHV